MAKAAKHIKVIGARVNNLKNINVSIPRDSLTVITGLSGSGKSSLAFDTIFAEGQRRYIDTFSSYSREYIGTIQRPDVDKIVGLSPVISIDQKTTSRNPRSTVGTVTEIYDFLRLLYARAAEPYSWASGEKMVKLTDEQILEVIRRDYAGQKIMLLAPMVNNRKGHYKELFDTLRKKGFSRVRVDGEVRELVFGMKVDRYKNHTIEVVVDRLANPETMDVHRLLQSIDKTMTQGNGAMEVLTCNSQLPPSGATTLNSKLSTLHFYSRNLMCPVTGMSYPEPAPHTFSFNSPSGWCPTCKGLGYIKQFRVESLEFRGDEELDDIIHSDDWFEKLLQYSEKDRPSESEANGLSGVGGVSESPERSGETEHSDAAGRLVCPDCQGKRLNKEALSYKFGGKTIDDLANMDIQALYDFLGNLDNLDTLGKIDSPDNLNTKQLAIAAPIVKEIRTRLEFMLSVGLSYLSLSRSSDSLSGGESQRIRLATQIGSRLVNVLYILDEPSIGLHQRDNQRLIESLKQLRDMGNSVIVVEHDEQIMRQADYIVDIGPRAGRLGGEVVFQGTPEELLKADTLTAQYLRDSVESLKLKVLSPQGARLFERSSKVESLKDIKCLLLKGCKGNNLKNIDVSFPLGKMIGVTGVSGSGKSTLINQTLYPILSQHFYRSLQQPLPYDSIEGLENIDKVIAVNQAPIGRSPRSNPATYTSVFNDIRELFAQVPQARMRGWKAGRFSFNAAGGRCEECSGNGYKRIEMHFMPDVFVPCEVCGGQRYNRETLEVRFKGKTIADVLDMTVNQAVEFFEAQPTILKKIKTIQDVGLGYIKLGQSSTSLSGGESQRVKLATELSKTGTGRTVYILDEPTTGLHFEDIKILMSVLRKLVDRGNTVIIIEHNLDVIRECDYLIDLGPEGGHAGGQIVAVGTQEDIKACDASLTGRYL
ncbi:MAG: excinuclease ABC subunit UvrA [Paludibacteraceae bacterium]|nr:excinuclease ABC subunit UvrA [Paludibacteraceae bacterium]